MICNRFKALLIPAIAANLVAAPPAAAVEGALKPKPILFRHATIVDAQANQLKPDMAILVEKDRISKIVPDAEVKALISKDTKVMDLKGQYVAPGLLDSHVHLATAPIMKDAQARLRLYANGGITTVRDMSGDARILAELRRQVLVGETIGPRVHFSANFSGPAFFEDPRTVMSTRGHTSGEVPWCMGITKDTNLVEAVAMAKGTYASGIKLYANLDPELANRIVQEAKRQNFPCWSHFSLTPSGASTDASLPSEVVSTGLASVSHVDMILLETAKSRDYTNGKTDDPRFQKIFQIMKEKGVALDATMTIYKHMDPAMLKSRPDMKEKLEAANAFSIEMVKRAHKAGVTILAGSDWVAPFKTGKPALWEEMEGLQDLAGLSPAETLLTATQNAAKAMGMERECGTVEEGKRADLIVLKENPLKDIKAIRSLQLTVAAGRVLPRKSYKPTPSELQATVGH